MNTLYITGAGVSAKSGIPTFRGRDGFWTVGSVNYTPQQMATRHMYMKQPGEFLLWYYKRFVNLGEVKPNAVHYWLSNKKLITQNIDVLDWVAGNESYIPIHGRLDKVTILHEQGETVKLEQAPWENIQNTISDPEDKDTIKAILLDAFKISRIKLLPEPYVSLKPFVLLFDEIYTELYKISLAMEWIDGADKIVFMGTSFSVNITVMALERAVKNSSLIEVVDPDPVDLGIPTVEYKKMNSENYVKTFGF